MSINKDMRGDVHSRHLKVQSNLQNLLALIGCSRHAVTAFLSGGVLLGLFWVSQTDRWQTSVRITLHSRVAGYSERTFWDAATKKWLARLSESAAREQDQSGLQIFVSGSDPLNLFVSCSHRTRGVAAPVLQRVLEHTSELVASTEKMSVELSRSNSSKAPAADNDPSENLRDVLQAIDSGLSKICRELKISRQRFQLDGAIRTMGYTAEGGDVPIGIVTWYPWYTSLQREYSHISSVVAEQHFDTPSIDSIEAELSSIAEQLERSSVLLVLAWKGMNTRNAANWAVDVWHGAPYEESVLWRKRLLDPLLTGIFLGVLSSGTWIASKRWLFETPLIALQD